MVSQPIVSDHLFLMLLKYFFRTDGGLVGLGCLYFNTSEAMTWLEASVSCQRGGDQPAHLLEIQSQGVN